MSREREALLRLYGARVEIVESMGGMNEAVEAARALARDDDVFLPDQFSNPANPEAHRTGTGPEILAALDGEVDVFVAGVGHRRDDHRRRRGAQGAQPEGAGHRASSRSPRRCCRAARPARTASRGSARASCRRCSTARCSTRSSRSPTRTRSRPPALAAAREGVLAGISCGAALWGALQVAQRPESRGKRIVTRPARTPASATSRRRSSRRAIRPRPAEKRARRARPGTTPPSPATARSRPRR